MDGILYRVFQGSADLPPDFYGLGLVFQPSATVYTGFEDYTAPVFAYWTEVQLYAAPVLLGDFDLRRSAVAQAEGPEVTIQAVPNDARYTDGSLWGMYGNTSGPANAFGSQAAEAWAQGHTGSMANVIGVIDTGIDYTHPDLYLNIWLNQREIPVTLRASLSDIDEDGLITFRDLNGSANARYVLDYNSNGRIDAGDLLNDIRWENGVDEDGNGYADDLIGWDFANNDNDPMDDNNHGTHVAGTIGALGGNGIGVVGVNWNVQMVALKFLSATSFGSISHAVSAVNYFTAAAANASTAENFIATNNSWGGGSFNPALLDAITQAAQQDILFVAAAGNTSQNNDANPRYPTGYSTAPQTGWEAVVSVASITSSGTLSSFSNFGAASVDIAAPGSSIWSAISNGGYGAFNGTSMATPHVTGALALYASLFPNATSIQIREALLGSANATVSLFDRVASDGTLDISAMLAIVPPITEFADWVGGTLGDDSVNGRDGKDTISTAFGNDTIDGGPGEDVLFGDDGQDWLSGGAGVARKLFLIAEQNPFASIDVGFGAAPAFADLDSDGDLDLIVGRSDGGLSGFRRNLDGSFTPMDGIATNPVNPFGRIDIGAYSVPTFTDFDANGTMDLIIGRDDGTLAAFGRNFDGTYTAMDGVGSNPVNPFLGVMVSRYSAPSFTDLDFDGDQDLVLGGIEGTLAAYERGSDGRYTALDGLNGRLANPFANIDVGLYSIPSFADLDNDGDQDLVLGGNSGNLMSFRRDGDGSFTSMNGQNGNPANPLALAMVGYDSAPVFSDINGDAQLDVVIGSGSGALTLILSSQIIENMDSLAGGNGADTLSGMDGADTLNGGAGDDLFIISDAFDLIIEAADGGADTIITSVSVTMPDHVEVLRVAADVTGLALSGSAGDDVILVGNVTLTDIYALFAT